MDIHIPEENIRSVPAVEARPACDHYWAAVHEPGHRLYWIMQCMLCHRIDWDELDEQIAFATEPTPTEVADLNRDDKGG